MQYTVHIPRASWLVKAIIEANLWKRKIKIKKQNWKTKQEFESYVSSVTSSASNTRVLTSLEFASVTKEGIEL